MATRLHTVPWLAGIAALGVAGLAGGLWLASSRGPNSDAEWGVIRHYCLDCHNDLDLAGDTSFEHLGPADIAAHAETFETAVRKLRGSLMPPPGNPRPDRAEVETLIGWLENTLDRAPNMPRAGHVPAQRLNRTEYAAAVRDLLAVGIDPAEYLPTEIEVDGFTNMAAALTVSPAFLEQYLSVARKVAHIAVGEPSPKLASAFYTPPDGDQDGHTDGLALGTRGGMRFVHNFPADGEYRFNITGLEVDVYTRSLESVNTLVMLVDHEEVFRGNLGGPEDMATVDRDGATGRAKIMRRFRNIPVTVAAGEHEVVVSFIERSQAATNTHIFGFVPYGGFSFKGEQRVARLSGGVEVVGPYDSTGVSRTPSREKLFVCVPEVPDRERDCAEQIATNLARRAFRRPVNADDLASLMPYFEAGRAESGSFDGGVEQLVSAVLVSPDFLYRAIEPSATTSDAGHYALSGLELASRLSFFLWGQGPDDVLFSLATAEKLSQPETLAAEAQRMLRDPRAASLVDVFALRWLDVNDLTSVDPDAALFPEFSEELRADFSSEIELFLKSILLEDRSITELLTADYTFLNDRLASHYGIDGVYGPQFRRVKLSNPARFGLLGKAAVLLHTSYGNRTSPVVRGAWVLDKLMGTPPTPPPANVNTDLSTPEGEAPKTLRVRLERHRTAPNCAACHGVIDPYGLALENFTVLGQWRDVDRAANAPIDPRTMLADGRDINGPVELREALLERPDQFIQAFTEKLMMYALGRKLEYHDMRQVREIVHAAAEKNYTLSAIVDGIVASDAFRMQAAEPEE